MEFPAVFCLFFMSWSSCITIEQGPGGIWCEVDVVEFSYYGAPAATPKEQLYTELVDGLRGSDPYIGSGSQVRYFFLCSLLVLRRIEGSELSS